MDRVSNRATTWNLINIKARREQTTEHYVQIFRSLYEQDPLVGFPHGGKSGVTRQFYAVGQRQIL